MLGFVINELWQEGEQAAERCAAWLARLCELLSDDGALIVLEPALRAQSRALQRVRGVLASVAGPPHVFAPCLHRGACPLLERERDWCHEQLPLPLPQAVNEAFSPVRTRLHTNSVAQAHLLCQEFRFPQSLQERGSFP